MGPNRLFYGDNLDVLRQRVKDESVDLVYLDPPFNSNRNYSVIFNRNGGVDADVTAQIEAFEDTWHWTPITDSQYAEFLAIAPGPAADALSAFRGLLGENDAMAYLTNMAPRLLELRRVLKPTGSIYLHCDPTMSHYLKLLMDAIFGPEFFRNEIIWKRTSAHNRATRFGPVHDVILTYTKSKNWTWNKVFQKYDDEYVESNFNQKDASGRRFSTADLTSANPGSLYEWKGSGPPGRRYWGVALETMRELEAQGRLYYTRNGLPRKKIYLDETRGMQAQDVWTDIPPISSNAAERLGYPTQKPLRLLERIIAASSNPGDVVLDPFCGCGTTVDAAQYLGRQWIGIDITYIAVDLILKRLQHTHGKKVRDAIDVNGIPHDMGSAQALFERSPFDFERWAVSMVNAEPNQRQVGDKGIDGVARFPLGGQGKRIGKVLVSVKGGKNVPPTFVRDLVGTIQQTEGAAMGVLLTMQPLTRGAQEVIDKSGIYRHPLNSQEYPVLQHFTVRELLDGRQPKVPPTFLPYIAASKLAVAVQEASLF